MNILITGGLGFIGRNLVNSLSHFHQISIYDNYSNSKPNGDFLQKNVQIIKGDVQNYGLLKKSLVNIDCVIHLAAQIDVQRSIIDPDETYEINIKGTDNLLDACLENNVGNFITASSAAVYGNPTSIPLDENSQLNPLSPYGKSKMIMEQKIFNFSLKHNINSICLRFFNIYGNNQNASYAGVISKFLQNIKQNEPLTIFGSGDQTRDFIAIEDVISAINCAISNIDKKIGKIYNVGTGNSISLNELAEIMLNISKKDLPINHIKMKSGDVLLSQSNIDLIKNELNFIPRINIKDGLKLLIKDLT
jgi:UDP-glucose 4-epimerase